MNALRWTRLVDHLPGWARVLPGLCGVGAGALLALRPFTSVGVLVVLLVAGLVISGADDVATGARVAGRCELLAAAAIAARPGYVLRWCGLVLVGLVLVVRRLRRAPDHGVAGSAAWPRSPRRPTSSRW